MKASRPRARRLRGGERGHLPAQRAGRLLLPPRSRRTPSGQRCPGNAAGRPAPVPTPTRGVSRRGRQTWRSARQARPSRPLRHGAGAERAGVGRDWRRTLGTALSNRCHPSRIPGAQRGSGVALIAFFPSDSPPAFRYLPRSHRDARSRGEAATGGPGPAPPGPQRAGGATGGRSGAQPAGRYRPRGGGAAVSLPARPAEQGPLLSGVLPWL